MNRREFFGLSAASLAALFGVKGLAAATPPTRLPPPGDALESFHLQRSYELDHEGRTHYLTYGRMRLKLSASDAEKNAAVLAEVHRIPVPTGCRLEYRHVRFNVQASEWEWDERAVEAA